MAQFATAQELADRLGVEFTAADEVRADGLLTRASGLVTAAAKQQIELAEDDELTVRGTRESTILLPERPVVAVTSVTFNDDEDPLDDEEYWLEDDSLVRRGGWGCDLDTLTILYTHGWDPIPDAIKEIVLGAVVRVWVNPGAVMSERLGQAQLTYAMQGTPSGLLLTADERRTVRQVVSRGSESLPIR